MAAKAGETTAPIGPAPINAEGIEEEIAGETSPLLTKKGQSSSNEDVHYRNIDGTRFWILFASIIFGITIAFFDSTLMASAHPVITSYFHSSNSASWLSTVFYLTSTVSQPIYGRVSDTWGRRSVFSFAAVLFFISTAWCALSQNIGEFIAARAVAGLGAGGVMSVSSIITSDIVKIEYRGIYQSYYNMAYGVGNLMGACLGGLLCDQLGWRWAFGVQLPFIFVFVILSWLSTPNDLGPNLAFSQGKSIKEAFETFDTKGAVVLTTTITCLILGINLGGNVLTWSNPFVIIMLVLSLIGCIVLPPISRQAKRPMLPLPLLTKPPSALLVWSQFFFGICNNAVIFNVPLYLQAVRQTTPTVSGLYLISPLFWVSATAIFTGFFITYTRRMKAPLVAGMVFLLAGAIGTTCLSIETPFWLVLVLITGTAAGQGFFYPTVTIAVLALSTEDEQAVVVTTSGLSRSLGSIMGVAVSSWALQNALPMFLEMEVTGQQSVKERIIQEVRKSVEAIHKLDPVHKAEVIKAYSEALRMTFAVGVLWAIVVTVLIVLIKLPRLQSQKEKDQGEERANGLLNEVQEEAMGDGDAQISRQTGHLHALQLGRRASNDTTL